MRTIILAFILFSTYIYANDKVTKYQQACNNGDGLNCYSLGLLYQEGKGIK